MSTELKSKTERFLLNRFAGGLSRGVCMQITEKRPSNIDPMKFGYISVTREEAKTLALDLLAFALGEEEEDWS